MKIRVVSFSEIESAIMDLCLELESIPLDVGSILEKGQALPVLLRLCISQMQAPNSGTYPGKHKHYEILQIASKSITYKVNTCTFDEIQSQINEASQAFGKH
jgi:hypothetical protein